MTNGVIIIIVVHNKLQRQRHVAVSEAVQTMSRYCWRLAFCTTNYHKDKILIDFGKTLSIC
ncbi:hypothetical protein [Perigonia lusca single nucleopolyhedrovirus]|uniref:Uncharacterized protein n=1 Tax=Perigonia lusca single nucleopolyhedrovirus TaxID=1675865 RepID=A0A0M3WP87_9ABAC|nr:hypothetical protein [Perigonia lusca single nucleopolyhedrovirus]AKN80600.1 hypothetical protein [Perigonia lusca single nucleopolyhedrovirus]